MRSILLQTRRTTSSRSLLLPRLPSSSLSRRFNSTILSSDPTSTLKTTTTNPSSSLPFSSHELPASTSTSSSKELSPPPPLPVSSSSTTASPAPAAPASTSKENSKPVRWYSHVSLHNRRARARALVDQLEQGGGGAGDPDFLAEAGRLTSSLHRFSWPTDEDIRLLSTIYVAMSKSPAAPEEEEERRRIQGQRLLRLLILFTRRLEIKSDSFVGSLRSVLQHSHPMEGELAWDSPTFRSLAVNLAAGATNASEAVEIVEGLRRASPSSFTDMEFEEVLQSIGRVEDWTTTTRNSFDDLPSFPDPILPPAQPPFQPSPPPPPSNPPTPPLPSSKPRYPVPLPPTLIYPFASAPPPRPPPTPPPQPPSTLQPVTPERLLKFSRVLSTAPPPTVEDLQTALDLFQQAYEPQEESGKRTKRPLLFETVVRILVYANRGRSPPDPRGKRHFGGLVARIVAELLSSHHLVVPVSLESLGVDFQTELLPLVRRLRRRNRVRFFAETFYIWRKEDYGEEELKILVEAMDRSQRKGEEDGELATWQDWEKGFEARLGELMEEASSRNNPNSSKRTDLEWVEESKSRLEEDPSVIRGAAYARIYSRPVQATPSSLESVVVASELYRRYAPSDGGLPLNWRQHGDAIVRILLIFANHRGPTPSFQDLKPLLVDLHHLPPTFIPSTPSFPSFALPLLPISTNAIEALAIVDSTLHAQRLDLAVLPDLWISFLASIERHDLPADPALILDSELFRLVDTSSSAEPGFALEDVIQVYLRRWRRVTVTVNRGSDDDAEEKERVAFGQLEELVKEHKEREGRKWGSSIFGTLMEVQAAVRRDWNAVFRIWEELQRGVGLDSKAVEMYLLACLETSSLDRADLLLSSFRTHPTTLLPLLTPPSWSLYYSLLVKVKELPSLVESISFQAGPNEHASPLALEDLAKGIELAREVKGKEGEWAERKMREVVGEEVFEEGVRRWVLGGGGKTRKEKREEKKRQAGLELD